VLTLETTLKVEDDISDIHDLDDSSTDYRYIRDAEYVNFHLMVWLLIWHVLILSENS